MLIEFLERVQTQEIDGLYYIWYFLSPDWSRFLKKKLYNLGTLKVVFVVFFAACRMSK